MRTSGFLCHFYFQKLKLYLKPMDLLALLYFLNEGLFTFLATFLKKESKAYGTTILSVSPFVCHLLITFE